jgi:hypothetical protein
MEHDTTITFFNRYVNGHEDHYKATVINDVLFFGNVLKSLSADGLAAQNAYTIRIPEDAPKVDYVPEEKWNGSDHSGWTLQAGDYIVIGELLLDDITPASIRSAGYMVIAVKGYTVNLRGAHPHWKVIGA